jgi:DNA-binding MarR family transcriptional regulator
LPERPQRKTDPAKPLRRARTAPAPIDYGPLRDDIGYVLRRAQLAVFQRFFETFAAFDIRPAQYSALTLIEHNPGISQAQVADALGIKRPNFVAMVDALEARGLATRVPAETDRRFYGLYLTEAGRALMTRLHQIARAGERAMVERLGPTGYQRLRDALLKVAEP